jgi:hypothetical protein
MMTEFIDTLLRILVIGPLAALAMAFVIGGIAAIVWMIAEIIDG